MFRRMDGPLKEEHPSKRRCLPVHNSAYYDTSDSSAADHALPSILALNDDCLDIILSFFGIREYFRMSTTCKRWYNLCLSRISRIKRLRTTALRDCPLFATKTVDHLSVERLLSVLSLNNGSLTSLSLFRITNLTPSLFSVTADLMPNLTKLHIGKTFALTHRLAKVIGQKICPNLESLSLDCSNKYLTSKEVEYMLSFTRKLKSFAITATGNYEGSGRSVCIGESLSSINPLSSFSCHQFADLQPCCFEYILRNFSSTLQHLDVSGTNIDVLNINANLLPRLENMKTFLATRWNDVRLIHPGSFPFKCTNQLISILKVSPNLVKLDISRQLRFQRNGVDIVDNVDVLSRHCLFLEELNLSECLISAENLIKLNKLSNLKKLSLDYNCYRTRCINYTFHDNEIGYDVVSCFKIIAAQVLPLLDNLAYLSMKDERNVLPVDDIVLFIKNTSPNFKELRISTLAGDRILTADSQELWNSFHNFIEEALEKCQGLNKEDHSIKLVVDGLFSLHRNSCKKNGRDCSCSRDYPIFYEEVAPKFLQVVGSGDQIRSLSWFK